MKNCAKLGELLELVNIWSEEVSERVTALDCKVVFIDTTENIEAQRKKIIAAFDDLKVLKNDHNIRYEVNMNALYTLEDGKNHVFRSAGFMVLKDVGKEIFKEAVFSMCNEPNAIFAQVSDYNKIEVIKSYIIIGV